MSVIDAPAVRGLVYVDDGASGFGRRRRGRGFAYLDVGSVDALGQLRQLGPPSSETEAKVQTREAIKATAAVLRNTATVCRQSYVHPTVLEAHADGRLQPSQAAPARGRPPQRRRAAVDGAARTGQLT